MAVCVQGLSALAYYHWAVPPLNCEKSHIWPKMQPWRSSLTKIVATDVRFKTKMQRIRFHVYVSITALLEMP